VDWNNDKRLDLLTGENSGNVRIYLAGTNGLNAYTTVKAGGFPFAATGGFSMPEVVDWNNDGKKDLLVGNGNGTIHLLLNTGTDANPSFASATTLKVGATTTDLSVGSSGRASPVVVDWNHDGKKDLIVGETYGSLLYFENVGTDAAPKFNQNPVVLTSGSSQISVGYYSRLDVCDWDNDGTPDLLSGYEDYDQVAHGVYYFHVRHPPTIASVAAIAPSVVQGKPITITANGVSDVYGDVGACEFYRDSNGNGIVEPGVDQLLGTGTNAGGGAWSWTGSAGDFPVGSSRVLARAYHVNEWGSAASTTFTVTAPALQGAAGNDAYGVCLDATGQHVQIFENTPMSGPPDYQIACGMFKSLTINGGSSNDRLTVDFTRGNPIAGGSLSFNGGADEDVLTVIQNGSGTISAINAQVTLGGASVGLSNVEKQQIILTSLDVQDSAKCNIGPGGNKVFRTSGLSFGANGVLDLKDNDMIVAPAYDPGAMLDRVFDWIRLGRAGGAWTGKGIVSAAARDDATGFTGLGCALNKKDDTQVKLCETFNGLDVSINDILVKYTWNGDANLDGIVNADDYFRIDRGYISQKGGWYNGDFNYDKVVNADDYFLIDSVFIGQKGPLAGGDGPVVAAAPGQAWAFAKSPPRRPTDGAFDSLFSEAPVAWA